MKKVGEKVCGTDSCDIDLRELKMTDVSDEMVIYNVINPNNKYLDYDWLHKILSDHGIKETIKNKDLWQQAFVHSSYCTNPKKRRKDEILDLSELMEGVIQPFPKSNERLEWLGDSALSCFMGQYLFKRFPEEEEGYLSTSRSKLVKKETLAILGRKLGFGKFIMMSTATEKVADGRNNDHILEDCFESFIGALTIEFSDEEYLDEDYTKKIKGFNIRGYLYACIFLQNVYEKYIDIEEIINFNNNYKHQLMCYFQKNFGGIYPKYIQLSEWGKDKVFKIGIPDPINSKQFLAFGIARNKKDAEQLAAKELLRKYSIY